MTMMNKSAAVGLEEEFAHDLMGRLQDQPLPQEVEADVEKIWGKRSAESGHQAVAAIFAWATEHTGVISDSAIESLDAMIAEVDQALTDQVNEILHHPRFQQLEGTWRGLHRLVMNSDLSTDLQIRVLNISKEEIRKVFKAYPGGRWDESPLFKKIYQQEFGTLNGKPYGCLVGDYEFSHAPADLEVLRGMAKIAMHAHAPFIASAAPGIMKMESWHDINTPPDLSMIFTSDDYAPWRAFRKSEEAKYVGLTLPRFLSRLPYGRQGEQVKEFAFEEDVGDSDPARFCWSNSCYALAQNINNAFSLYGFATQIRGVESGGLVEDLPCYTFTTDDGGIDMTCPTEVAIPYARDYQLSNLGFMALCHAKGENWAAFIGGQSVHEPKEYDDPEATKNARLTAKLPYMFAISRFAHFLKKMVYLKVGTPMTRTQIEQWLNDWIGNYVLLNPDNAPPSLLAEKPLSAARVQVIESADDPGVYQAVFHLQPHFQLERIDVSLRLVSRLPNPSPR